MPASPIESAAPTVYSEHWKAGDVLDPECPSRVILEHLTSRWGVLVLIVLRQGTTRFGQLRRAIGIVSERMLAQTLRVLEADGFVERRALPVLPLHVEYSLTPSGEEAAAKVQALVDCIKGYRVSSEPRP